MLTGSCIGNWRANGRELSLVRWNHHHITLEFSYGFRDLKFGWTFHSVWIVITLRFVAKVERALKLQFISDFLYVEKAVLWFGRNRHIIYPSAQNSSQLREFSSVCIFVFVSIRNIILDKMATLFCGLFSNSFGCRLFFIYLLLLLLFVRFALE